LSANSTSTRPVDCSNLEHLSPNLQALNSRIWTTQTHFGGQKTTTQFKRGNMLRDRFGLQPKPKTKSFAKYHNQPINTINVS
jgi:hypothetical protein